MLAGHDHLRPRTDENLSGPQVPPLRRTSPAAMSNRLRSRAALRVTYSTLAPLYDWVVPWISSAARALGRTWLDVNNGQHLLDVGTGTGLALRPLADANPHGWSEGIDASPAMLTRARHRMRGCAHRRYGLRQAPATDLPYDDDTFDRLFSSYLLDLLPRSDRHSTLLEMRRVLRPQGRLVLVYLVPPQHPQERVWTHLARLFPPLLGGSRPIPLRSSLEAAGLCELRHATRVQSGLRSGILVAVPR